MGIASMIHDWVAEYGPVETDDTFRPGRFGVIGRDRLLRLADMVERLERRDNECADLTGASTKHHHHEPTVEDVLRDMHAKLDEVTALYVGEAIDSDERDSDEARIFAEYATKLMLRED